MPGQLKHPQLVLLCLWLYMQVQGQLKMRIGKGERFERDGKQCTAVRITLVLSVRPSQSWQTVWHQQSRQRGAVGKKDLDGRGHPDGKPYQVSRGRRPLGQHLSFSR